MTKSIESSRRCTAAPFGVRPRAVVVAIAAVGAVGTAGTSFAQSWALPGTTGPGTSAAPSWAQPVINPRTGQQSAPSTGWSIQPGLRLQTTYTNNVALAPKGQEKGDVVTELTPGLNIRGITPRVQVFGTLGVTGAWFWNESQYNRVVPSANLRGRLEAIERLAFIEASVLAGPQFGSFLGAQPTTSVATSPNTFTQYIYTVSPYIQRRFDGGTSVLLRNDNVWAQASGNTTIRDSYTQQWTAIADHPLNQFLIAGASYNYNSIEYQNSSPLTNDIARGRLTWRPDPVYQLYATGGYETNNYALGDREGATYGGGGRWSPTERTNLIGDWERRFFGSSYLYAANHRTRSAAFDVRRSRGINTFPQLVAGANTINYAAQYDAALAGSIADPVAREAAVNQLLAQLGLPATASTVSGFFSQQVFIQERTEGSVTLTGVRNTAGLTLFQGRTESVPTQSGVLTTFNTRQRGATLSWNSRLTQTLALNVTGTRFINEIVSGGLGTTTGDSTNTVYRAVLSTPLSPRTDVFGGARHYRLDSTVNEAVRETAVFAGLGLRF